MPFSASAPPRTVPGPAPPPGPGGRRPPARPGGARHAAPGRRPGFPATVAVGMLLGALAPMALAAGVPGAGGPGPGGAASVVEAGAVPICDVPWRRGDAAVERLIRCVARHYRAPGGPQRAVEVAMCESDLRADAYNPTGCAGWGCGGLFQQHARYWRERAGAHGFEGASMDDARANVIVSVRMAVERGTWEADWPVCGGG
ncbi:MAG: hypothetical protein HY658_05295 [Actinobacteria bacterium]|nr:hypothetical protein [Actinomycetota bacterium]